MDIIIFDEMNQHYANKITLRWEPIHTNIVMKRYRSFSISTYFEVKSIGDKYRTKNKCTKEEYIRYKHFASKGQVANYKEFKRQWNIPS